MEQPVVKQRNNMVDILRGIAMLLVVLGHTMTGCTQDSQKSFLFNVVWTLQMPLFMLISGYVNQYSKPIRSLKSLSGFVLKRTRGYLLPFVVWTFLIRGVIFGQTGYLNVGRLVYHMDDGYWFLFSVWSIAMIWGIANFMSEVFLKNRSKYIKLAGMGVFYICGMAGLAAIGYCVGLSFLSIKLTLYYMPFYFVGFLFGKIDLDLHANKHYTDLKELVVAISLVVWIFLLNRYNFYETGDSGFGIVLRATASLFGSITVCGLVRGLINANASCEKTIRGGVQGHNVGRGKFPGDLPDTLPFALNGETRYTANVQYTNRSNDHNCQLCVHTCNGCDHHQTDKGQQSIEYVPLWERTLSFVGTHSLEIYVMHGFFLSTLKFSSAPLFDTIQGMLLVGANFMITVALSMFAARLINGNHILVGILCGKSK